MTLDVSTAAGLAEISALRERFIADPTTDLYGLRPRIEQSWLRTAAMGLDPGAPVATVDSRASVDKQTLRYVGPVLEELEHAAVEAGGAVTLTAPSGVQVRCSGQYLDDRLGRGLVLLESVCGTNSDGTALEDRRSGWFHSREHYLEDPTFQMSSCYSALVIDPFRHAVRAILGLTLPEPVALKSDLRAAALLVEAAAARITQQLAARSVSSEEALLREYLKMRRRYQNAAVLATDGKDTMLTEHAAQLLRDDDLSIVSAHANDALRGGEASATRVNLSGGRSFELQISTPGPKQNPVGAVVLIQRDRSNDESRRRMALRESSPHSDLRPDRAAGIFGDLVGGSESFSRALDLGTMCATQHRSAHLIGESGVGKHSIALRIARSWEPGEPHVVQCGTVSSGELRAAWESGRGLVLSDCDLLSTTVAEALVNRVRGGRAPLCVVVARRPTFAVLKVAAAVCSVEITLPSLRHRRDDIPALAQAFLAELTERRASPRLLRLLTQGDWFGNAKQLRSVLAQTVDGASGPEITVADLPPKVGLSALEGLSRLEQVELLEFRAALQETAGNVTEAARVLQIGRSTLYRRLDAYKRRGIQL